MGPCSQDDLKAQEFADAAQAYIAHLTAHIEKENAVLFPMADRLIKADVMDELAKQFDRHEEQVIGQGRHEELHELLREMKRKYLSN